MKSLFELAEKSAGVLGSNTRIGCMFSTGKDSIANLSVISKYFKNIDLIFLYFVQGLKYKDDFINYYAERFKVSNVYQYPLQDSFNMKSKGVYCINFNPQIKVIQADIEKLIKKETGLEWMSWGYKKTDSLQRGGILRGCNCIDEKYKKLYVLGDWNNKDVFNYLKKEKLPLPIEYAHGFRDIGNFKGKSLIWLKNTFPDDYRRVIEEFPLLEASIIREEIERNG